MLGLYECGGVEKYCYLALCCQRVFFSMID